MYDKYFKYKSALSSNFNKTDNIENTINTYNI